MEFERGDVIRISTTKSNGCVQDGFRPAVVVSNNIGNQRSTILIVAPMTTVLKKQSQPTHMIVKGHGLDYVSMIMTEQLFTVDKSDVTEKLGYLSNKELQVLNKAIRISLDV